jgi:hypothetical protein
LSGAGYALQNILRRCLHPLSVSVAQASTVDVSFVRTEVDINIWEFDFTLTNNSSGFINYFEVDFPNFQLLNGSGMDTLGWMTSFKCCSATGQAIIFTNNQPGIAPGETFGIFTAYNGENTPLSALDWVAHITVPGSPDFLTVTGTATLTPIPAALLLFASGAVVLCYISWRRKKKAAALAT